MEQEIARPSLEILLRVSRELATTLDLHTVLSRVLTLSTENIGAERASLVVLNSDLEPVDAAIIFRGIMTSNTLEQMQDVVTNGLAGWVVRHRKPALIPDTSKDERWLIRPGETERNNREKSAICVPLMAQEKLVGVLTIVHPMVGYFNEAHLSLQQAIADMSGIAIRNAQLYEDLQGARKRYYDLFEDSIDPIFITDLNGKIMEVNHEAAHVTGYSTNELMQMNMDDLHSRIQEFTGASLELIPMQGSVTYEGTLNCRKNVQLPVEVYISRILLENNQLIRWIFRDIKERKDLDSLREDLSAMIYHDLRSPLANIISSLEILSTLIPMEDGTPVQSVYQIATRSTERMQRLISSLLDINRIESGQSVVEKKPVVMEDLVEDAIEAILPNASGKNQRLEKKVPPDLPLINVDEDMIRRVLINLIENASKYSPSKTVIQVGASVKDNTACFWVDDKGPGIPENSSDRIFDKFTRIYGQSMSKGLGLGLAFCRLAVQAHGGKIWVENLPDGGSRFIFSLPVE